MREHSLRTLEFDKIRARLASHTAFSGGRALAETLLPSSDRAEVVLRHRLVAETRRLQVAKPNLGFAGAHDIRGLADKASIAGVLEPREFLEIQSTLICARTWSQNLERLSARYTLLQHIASGIDPLSHLIDAISRSITQTAEVSSNASSALGAIRRNLQTTHDRLLVRINEILASAAGRSAAQEPIVTQRSGRYVIPIKAEMKGSVRGIVHDVSQSGATLFVEPLAIVDLGNEWRELQVEEEREVERILRELSAMTGSVAGQIVANVEALAEFDLLFAKVRLGEVIRARDLPDDSDDQQWITAGGELRLQRGRHPLIGPTVVPMSVRAGGEFSVLLITGPNTGGKTVALKTAGLLTLMALAGLPTPADPGSTVPVYSEVFADIGDEQSIEQSLSTFSSHLRNVIEVIRDADSRSLVLLDELGAGTDPEEGAAIAQAVVETLVERGCTVVATTHHSQLKLFAQQHAAVENASVEFDEETLAPTYRLLVGIPGRSNAIAIARRLGLPGPIVDRATELTSHEHGELDSLVANIQRRSAELDAMHADQAAALRQAEELRRDAAERVAELEASRQDMLEQTAFEMERELEGLRAQVSRAARAAGRASTTGTPDVEEAKAAKHEAEEVHRRVRRRLATRPSRAEELPAAAIQPGDRVWLRGLGAPGEAQSRPDERGEVDVTLGGLRTRVRIEQVERIQRPARTERGAIAVPAAPLMAPEIEVRAQRVEEVMPRIERFLDDAALAGLRRVRIVHGKGTGTLRRVVREMLADHPLVTSYETAAREDGGEGVTVAYLAS